MAKSPAFQLYASDFYMDTNHWTIEEIGIYQRLLLTQWVNGYVPNDEVRLARIAGCGLRKFQKWWPSIKVKFDLNGSNELKNLRLEEVRNNQLKYSESRRKNVSIRYKDKPTYEPTYEKDMKAVCNLSSSSSSSSSSNIKEKNIKKRKILDLESPKFEEFWKAYPKRNGVKVGKSECKSFFLKEIKETDYLDLITATNNYANSKQAKEGYAIDPIRYLKRELWRDWVTVEQDVPTDKLDRLLYDIKMETKDGYTKPPTKLY